MKTRSGRAASQREDELAEFIALLRQNQVVRYMEVGVRHGDTFYEIMTALPTGSRGVALDLPGGPWGKQHSDGFLRAAADDLSRSGYNIKLVLGSSHASHIRTRVRAMAPHDAILIDADHSYDAVKADWEFFRSMAPIIAFHDIDGDGQIDKHTGAKVDVPRLWQEIKAEYSTHEIIGAQRGMGIGVVFMERPARRKPARQAEQTSETSPATDDETS